MDLARYLRPRPRVAVLVSVNPPDPCLRLTEEQFNLGYPDFQGRGMLGIVAFHLSMAATLIDPKVWERHTALGHGLLTAHMLCNSPSGKNAKMAAVNGQTTYGKMYDSLKRIVFGKVRPTL